MLSYNAITGQGSLAVDLTGNGQASLLIKTVGQVRAGDVLVSTLQQPSGPNNPVEPPHQKPHKQPGMKHYLSLKHSTAATPHKTNLSAM